MCMRTRVALALGASLSALAAGSAFGDTLKGSYVNVYGPKNVAVHADNWAQGGQFGNNNTTTRQFNWTRSDLPAGPGVDTTIPEQFHSYCVDLDTFINANQTYTFQVITPGAYGFNATQILLLSRLWGGFESQVSNSDQAAAFQVAVYEIQRDGANLNLSSGHFSVQDNENTANLKQIASQWLSQVADMNVNLPTPDLAVLLAPNFVQHQLTIRPLIPAPATGVLGMMGAGLLASRRRRRGA